MFYLERFLVECVRIENFHNALSDLDANAFLAFDG
jgi:hypothetical protein